MGIDAMSPEYSRKDAFVAIVVQAGTSRVSASH